MKKLKADDWVEVRSKEEILRTLDANGRLEELPFMPQMFKYCGERFRVYKSAHKTCDTVSGKYDGRRLAGGIHLDLRCDGQAYGGCGAACLIFWKEAWLKPVDDYSELAFSTSGASAGAIGNASCTEQDVYNGTIVPNRKPGAETRYLCQATHLIEFTTPLAWYDFKQYLEDYRTGNVSIGRIVSGLVYVCYYYGSLANRGRIGIPARWLYNFVQSLWGGAPFPRNVGLVPAGELAPVADLNLQPGELVRVKSLKDILKTTDANERNRGMVFDAEMVPYCGKTFRVKSRVSGFVDEKTGKMLTMKTPAVILEGAFCQARYSSCRMLCPRSIYSWWREVWLERVQG
jgi:hypothetical protein